MKAENDAETERDWYGYGLDVIVPVAIPIAALLLVFLIPPDAVPVDRRLLVFALIMMMLIAWGIFRALRKRARGEPVFAKPFKTQARLRGSPWISGGLIVAILVLVVAFAIYPYDHIFGVGKRILFLSALAAIILIAVVLDTLHVLKRRDASS